MRLLYILSSTAMGGATHSVLTLIEQMRMKECDVFVIIPKEDITFIKILDALKVKSFVVYIRSKEYPTFEHFVSYYRWPVRLYKILRNNYIAKKKISKIIKENHIDIVHTNVGVITCGFEACLRTGTPHVWHIREYGDKDFNIKIFPSKRYYQKLLRRSYVITITRDLLEYNNLEGKSKAYVIYNGVRKAKDICYKSPKKNYFICASRISPEKGFDQILRVFADFHKLLPDYRLKILGFDPHNYSSKLIQQAKESEIIDFIDFEGYKNNVSDYMANARALLVASPYEGFGRMSAEAAFAGCLVVGKNTAGTREILNIMGGFPFISDNEMLESMIQVCSLSDIEYKEKAIYAQKQAIQFFSEENYIESIYEIYQKIINPG